jgi:hypothetical protein
MPLSNNGQNQVLDEIYNAGAGTFPAANSFVALHSADPGLAGTTNELTGGGYARQQTDFTAAASQTLSNVGAILWSVPAGDVAAWSIWDAVTAGNCFQVGFFSIVSGLAIVRAGTDVTNNDVQSNAHGLVANDRVAFEVVEGLTVPAGLTAGTLYYVIATGLTTDAFRVSATQGGAAVDITAAGSAIWRKVVVTNFSSAGQFQVNAGDLDVFGN